MDIQVSDECMDAEAARRAVRLERYRFEDPKMTNGEACISCMRCVEICPQSARSGNPEKVQMISEKLKMICQPDKANEFSDLEIVGRNVLKIYELKERTQFLPGPVEA